jgi:hypothetical protein
MRQPRADHGSARRRGSITLRARALVACGGHSPGRDVRVAPHPPQRGPAVRMAARQTACPPVTRPSGGLSLPQTPDACGWDGHAVGGEAHVWRRMSGTGRGERRRDRGSLDDPFGPEPVYEAGQIRCGGDEPAARPVGRRADRRPVELVRVVVRDLRNPRRLVTLEPRPIHRKRADRSRAPRGSRRSRSRCPSIRSPDREGNVACRARPAGRPARPDARRGPAPCAAARRTPRRGSSWGRPRYARAARAVWFPGGHRGRASGDAARGKLHSEWLVECQAPLAGEPDGHRGGHALRDARPAEGVVCLEGAALHPGQISACAAPHDAGARRLNARQRTRDGLRLRSGRWRAAGCSSRCSS